MFSASNPWFPSGTLKTPAQNIQEGDAPPAPTYFLTQEVTNGIEFVWARVKYY